MSKTLDDLDLNLDFGDDDDEQEIESPEQKTPTDDTPNKESEGSDEKSEPAADAENDESADNQDDPPAPKSKQDSERNMSSKTNKRKTPPADENTDFMSGAVEDFEVGSEVVSNLAVTRLKFQENQPARINVLPGGIKRKSHYTEEFNRIQYIPGVTDKKLGRPDVHAIVPVLYYPTLNSKGKPVDKGEDLADVVEIRAVQLSRGMSIQLKQMKDRGVDINKVDILVDCDDAQFQNVRMTAQDHCVWREDKEARKRIATYLEENLPAIREDLPRVGCKEITPDRFKQMMQSLDGDDSGNEGGNSDVNDYMK